SGANPAGAIGSATGLFTRCSSVFWNRQTDSGTPWVSPQDIGCNQSKTTSELQSPHPSPNKLINPYHNGLLITQALIDDPNFPFTQCQLGSGSDGDWGFGTCGVTPIIWQLNANNQYNTLVRIPNPGVQPL